MKLRELLEALTPGQKKYVDDKLSSSDLVYNPNQWDNIFGDHDRIYLEIPSQHPNVEVYKKLIELGYKITDYATGYAILRNPKVYDLKKVLGKNPELVNDWELDRNFFNINSAIEQMKYKILDYNKGTLTRENVPEAIGSIFSKNKVDKRILQLFANDPARATVHEYDEDIQEAEDLMIIISRNKYDVAEVSTNKKWTSCLNLGGGWSGVDTLGSGAGINAHRAIMDISVGCLATYLVRVGDTEINEPLARISIKPFINKANPSQVALGVHDTVYSVSGSYPPIYRNMVVKWADEINSNHELDGLFTLHPKAYNHAEFKKTQIGFGSYANDLKTAELYGYNNIDTVPKELLTPGYLLMVIKEARTKMIKEVIQYATTEKEAIAMITTSISRYLDTEDVGLLPDEYINDSNSIMSMLETVSEFRKSVLKTLVNSDSCISKNFFPLVYEKERKRFCKLYRFIDSDPENAGYLNDFIVGVRDNFPQFFKSIIIELSPLARYTANIFCMILSSLYKDGDNEVKDALISILSNSHTSYSTILTTCSLFPEIGEEYKKTIPEKIKVLESSSKKASSLAEVKDVFLQLNNIEKLLQSTGGDVFVLEPVYINLAMNDYSDVDIKRECVYHTDSIPALLHVLSNTPAASIIMIIGRLLGQRNAGESAYKKVKDAWINLADSDISSVIEECREADVIQRLFSYNMIVSSHYSTIYENICEDFYKGDVGLLIETFIDSIDTDKIHWFFDDAPYINVDEDEKSNIKKHLYDRLRYVIKHGDGSIPLSDSALFNLMPFIDVKDESLVHNLIKNPNMNDSLLPSLMEKYTADIAIPEFVVNKMREFVDANPHSSAFFYNKIDRAHSKVAHYLIEHLTNARLLLLSFQDEDAEIKQLKDKRLEEIVGTEWFSKYDLVNFIDGIPFMDLKILDLFLQNESLYRAKDISNMLSSSMQVIKEREPVNYEAMLELLENKIDEINDADNSIDMDKLDEFLDNFEGFEDGQHQYTYEEISQIFNISHPRAIFMVISECIDNGVVFPIDIRLNIRCF